MSWNEAEILAARGRILKAAHDMLAGTLSFIEGARLILEAISEAKLDERDTDLVPFRGIDSETDALPVGAERAHCQAAALVALQPEIDRMGTWAREQGASRCRSLVERFSSGQIEIRPLAFSN
jgi:hypothetical protein